MAYSSALQHLYGELAASLVRATTQRCEPHEPRTRVGAKVDGSGGLSAFEGACITLKELGLATSEWTRECRLLIDGDHVAHFVSNRARTGRVKLPPIDDVLNAWLSVFAGQLGYVSLKRIPFIPEHDVRTVMSSLEASGYAEQIDGAFLWTDKIAPAMQMEGRWDENGLSREELEEREVNLDMRRALASIPDDVRHAALMDDSVAVSKALAARWIKSVWLPDTVDEAPWWRLAALSPATMQLMELVKNIDHLSIDAVN